MYEFQSIYSHSSGEEENMEMLDCKDIYNNNYNCSSDNINNSYEDDMWKKYDNYLLTPPQSPPMIPTFENYVEYTSEFDMAINSLPASPIIDEELIDDAARLAAIDDVILNGGDSESLLNDLDDINLNEQFCTTSTSGTTINGMKLNLELLHDCMWSGQCNHNCNSTKDHFNFSSFSTTNILKRENNTSISCNTLGTSPTLSLINFALNDICANSCSTEGHLDDEEEEEDDNNDQIDGIQGNIKIERNSSELDACDDYEDDEEDENNQGEVDTFEGYKPHVNRKCVNHVAYDSGATLLASTNDSLKNDHSYGSPASSPRSIKKCKSLIYSSTKNCLRSKGLKVTAIKNENTHAMTIKFINKQNSPQNNNNNHNHNSKQPTQTELRRCKLSQSKRSSSHISPCSSPLSTSSSNSCSSSNSNCSSNNSSSHNKTKSRQINDYGPSSLLAKNSIMVNSITSTCSSSQSSVSSSSSLLSPTLSSSSQASITCSVRGGGGSQSSKTTKSMYPERRREHNDSERKRRDHLRNAFHYLRDQIPKLKDAQKKPARIVILGEATAFVRSLQEKQRYLDKMKDTETRKRDKLLKRLNALSDKKHI